MPHLSAAAADAIRRLVDDLVAGKFASIEADGRIGRLTREELERAIAEYPGTLVPLPADGMDAVYVYPIGGASQEWMVDVDLWTAEEGQSDLTLSLSVVETDGAVNVSIGDLHVL